MRFPAYPNYKPSGVEWLGNVPAHWKIERLKFCARTVMGQSPSSEFYSLDNDGVPFLQGNAEFGERFPTAKWSCDAAVKRVPVGALLLSVRAPVGAVNEADRTYGIGRGLCAVVVKVADLQAAFAWFSLQIIRTELDTKATGSTYDAVSAADVGNLQIALPPREEQCAISSFLDAETAKLDTLVAKNKALIDKLKEKRTALISRTVTRGLPPEAARAADLDPHPQLRPSGFDWLGDVPVHWDVKQLKWAVMFQRGHDLPSEDREDGLVPLVSSSGVSSTHSRAVARSPGIVTGRYGTIGRFYLVTEDYWPLNTTLYSIDLRANEPRFLLRMLTHLSPLFLLNAVKSAVPGVDRNDIHPIRTAVPPVPEQRAIADYLDRGTAKIDHMVAKVEATIERLQEYRTALITAAVTGKIDVRGVAA